MDAKGGFRLEDHTLSARQARLGPEAALALKEALQAFPSWGEAAAFFLPMAEAGLSGSQMARLAEKVPSDWHKDHREIYFDFRLGRWLRHFEPPTLDQCLEDYLANAETPEQGLAWLHARWEDFLRRHGA